MCRRINQVWHVLMIVIALQFATSSATATIDTTQLLPHVFRIVNEPGDTMYAADFWAYMAFAIANDSVLTRCRFGNVKLNDSRLWWADWTKDSLRVGTDSAISAMSCTKAFRIVTGDTISYFRVLDWRILAAAHADSAAYYYSEDTLDWVVTLHQASSGVRLVTIDSVGILRSVPPGFPTVYGSAPLLKNVKYVVPSTFNGDTIFLKVNVAARGTGDHPFARLDFRSSRTERLLLDSNETNRKNYYASGLGKRSEVERLISSRDLQLAPHVSTLSVSPSLTNLVINVSGNFLPGDRIMIVSLPGELISERAFARTPVASAETESFELSVPGKYYVLHVRKQRVLGLADVIVVH